MKTSIKTFIIVFAMAMLPACSVQKRADRHIRRAVELCPDLVQMKAHPIDTFLSVPGYTDIARVPIDKVFEDDAIFVGTEHGMITLSMDKTDSTLTVAFSAAPSEIRYRDTVNYSQVVLAKEQKQAKEWSFKNWLATLVCGLCIGAAFILWLLREKQENK
ncbi:MAG: hypothetical protein IKM99_09170 [Bacteroidales bacterium]|nr:hypothetical protein [Bacteroidales bacterium]